MPNPDIADEFDIEGFITDIKAQTEEYASLSYIANSGITNSGKVKKEGADELLELIIDKCADAMDRSGGDEDVMTVIVRGVLGHFTGTHATFTTAEKTNFLKELAARIGQLEENESEGDNTTGRESIKEVFNA